MADQTPFRGPKAITERDIRIGFLAGSLGGGVCLGGMMALLFGHFGWEGRGLAGEWAGPGGLGLTLGALHGFAWGFGFAATLGLLIWTAKSRIKFFCVFVVAMILMGFDTWLSSGWEEIVEIVWAFPKGLIVFLPSMLLAMTVPMRCSCPTRRRAGFKQFIGALVILAACVADTWMRFGWPTLLHALAIGVGLAVLVGLPMAILMKRLGPIEHSTEPTA